MARHTHEPPFQTRDFKQDAQRSLGVIQALPHQQVAIQQPVTHGVVVLEPIVVIRLHSLNRSAPILESDGVRSQNREASAGKRRPESLKWIAHLTGYFTLSEMKFPIVLMEYNYPAQRIAPLWCEQQSRNEITFESSVPDPFAKEPIEFLDVASLGFHRNRVRKS